MKRLLIFILALSAVALLVACGKQDRPQDTDVHADTEQTQGVESEDDAKNPETQPKEEEKTIFNVSEHGLVANAPEKAAENAKNLEELLKKAKKNSTVFFPEGDYYLESTSYGCINLYGARNLTLEGDGATVINASYDPTVKQSAATAGMSVILLLAECENVTVRNLSFDYAAYTQVCGRIVSVGDGKTAIKIDSRYTDGTSKRALTGGEYIMAVNALDENGLVKGDYYASDSGFSATLSGDIYTISGNFGSEGDTLVARFSLGNYASPTIFATGAKNVRFENFRSYSSPSATFYATLDNENFTFDGYHVAPPDNAEWLWGSNVDSIHIKGIRGTVTLKNSTFRGLGDDALNVHSIAGKVTKVSGDKVYLEYFYGGDLDGIWSRTGDEIEFYDKSFKLVATATARASNNGSVTLENVSGTIPVGSFARNKTTSPDLVIENVTVDGGRARAFLIQSKTATLKNCKISNLGLAAVIVAPDTKEWGEMGPCESFIASGLEIENVCTMKNDACRGAVMITNSHSGSVKGDGTLHGTVKITDSTFANTNAPALYAILTRDLTFTGNNLAGNTQSPVYTGCENVEVE